MKIKKIISLVLTFIGLFFAGFLIGDIGKLALVPSVFLVLSSLSIYGLEFRREDNERTN